MDNFYTHLSEQGLRGVGGPDGCLVKKIIFFLESLGLTLFITKTILNNLQFAKKISEFEVT